MNCSACKLNCCGGSSVNSPILMPFEEKEFINDSYDDNGFRRLKRNDKGLCVFLDENKRCSIYSKRPLECQIYPYILRYKNELISLELHDGCPQKDNAISREITSRKVPLDVILLSTDWWNKYEKLSI